MRNETKNTMNTYSHLHIITYLNHCRKENDILTAYKHHTSNSFTAFCQQPPESLDEIH